MLDPILSEIRQIRDAFSDKYHGDVTAMLAALRASSEASGRKTVTLTPRLYSPSSELKRVGAATKEVAVALPKRCLHTEPNAIHAEIVEQSNS